MLGIALWELLRVDDGGRPFAHLSEPAQIAEIMQSDDQLTFPVPLMWPDTETHEFHVLVEQCCSFEQEKRPTIDEVVDRLVLLEQNCNQPSGISLGKKTIFDVCFFFHSGTKIFILFNQLVLDDALIMKLREVLVYRSNF